MTDTSEAPIPPVDQPKGELELYVPGEFRCAKCGFTLSQFTLNANSGAVGSRDTPGEKCPNDGSPLWRVTWKQRALEHYDRVREEMTRADKAEMALNALATKQAVVTGADTLTAPILWSEIMAVTGKKGDPVDFSGLEVQSAACAILRNRRSALTAIPAAGVGETVCSVKTMKLSDNREEYYVSVMVGDREITPQRHRIKGRAEYEVAEWNWLLNGGEKPEIMDWLDRTADPDPTASPAVTERVQALEEALKPFADASDLIPESEADFKVIAIVPAGPHAAEFRKLAGMLTAGNFRRARAAIEDKLRALSEGSAK